MSERKPRKSLQQMAEREPMQIGGKPADVCPKCGAGMFVNGTRQPGSNIQRYVKCRNDKCGATFLSTQPPPTLIREVGNFDEPSSSGQETVAFRRDVA
jgi:hypothetical protein